MPSFIGYEAAQAKRVNLKQQHLTFNHYYNSCSAHPWGCLMTLFTVPSDEMVDEQYFDIFNNNHLSDK